MLQHLEWWIWMCSGMAYMRVPWLNDRKMLSQSQLILKEATASISWCCQAKGGQLLTRISEPWLTCTTTNSYTVELLREGRWLSGLGSYWAIVSRACFIQQSGYKKFKFVFRKPLVMCSVLMHCLRSVKWMHCLLKSMHRLNPVNMMHCLHSVKLIPCVLLNCKVYR